MDATAIRPEAIDHESTDLRSEQAVGARPVRDGLPAWLSGLRERLGPGDYVVYELDGSEKVIPLVGNDLHVGRSLSAHIRLEDIKVSRRHAILSHHDGSWHVLDDRSLNGLLLNGEDVADSAPLTDGDELIIGSTRLYLLL
jgi:pSer/pThr/pTyr-binding forkhead associated (FHA) protein